MPEIETHEILIVGGGKAGKTLAADLARAGHDVVLIERKMIGGTCINVGCIPTKALVKSAKVADLLARSSEFGFDVSDWTTNMPAVRDHKRAVVAGMIEINWNNLHNPLGDNFILGEAKFVAPRTVEVTPNHGGPIRRISGEKLFLNLGAKPIIPALPGLLEANPLTSESALELDRLPEHLIIIGGGYIGVELAQVFRRFGANVTIIQRSPHLLPTEDPDISEAIEALFRQDGINIFLNAKVLAVTGQSGEQVTLKIKQADHEQTLQGSDVLIATGRTPMTQNIGLSAAGVELDPHGIIRVNHRLETTAPSTWALGDCAGSPQQTHVSLDDYRIVKVDVFGNGNRTTTDRLIPHTVFIDPELGPRRPVRARSPRKRHPIPPRKSPRIRHPPRQNTCRNPGPSQALVAVEMIKSSASPCSAPKPAKLPPPCKWPCWANSPTPHYATASSPTPRWPKASTISSAPSENKPRTPYKSSSHFK